MVEHFSYFVIGGGSGGIASARRAAGYGAKVGIAEGVRLGGTCVNVGCIPKKMMWLCSSMRRSVLEAREYGFNHSVENNNPDFSWQYMKKRRDFTINRLNKIYETNIKNSGITLYKQFAKLIGRKDSLLHLQVGDQTITADNVLIATGSCPSPLDAPGAELCINSDQFFSMEELPKKVAIIGAGYIAAEFAGVLSELGAETHVFTRGETILRKFDEMIAHHIQEIMSHHCTMHPNSTIASVTLAAGDASPAAKGCGVLVVTTKKGLVVSGFNTVIVAIGRHSMIQHLGLENIPEIKQLQSGHLDVCDWQQTAVPGVYALGDVCGKVELTPMAIAAGRRLADKLFGDMPNAKADYENVPTVIFTHPPIGTIGLTEAEAVEKYGKENLRVYKSNFVDLYYSAFDMLPAEKPKTYVKLICYIPEKERVVGLHILGRNADEILQGFGVAIKMGATKADFDNCVAIHPTAAEELVTLPPWGLSP